MKSEPGEMLEILLPTEMAKRQSPETPKKILYDQAIIATLCWGLANFFYGLLVLPTFATSCLQFTGFIFVSIIFKVIQIRKL